MPYKLKLRIIGLLLIVIVSIILLILPSNFFDSGKSICISVLLFNRECFGCGMTRAIQHLIHLEFKQAYGYNRLSFLAFPLIVYLIIEEFIKLFKEIYNKK